MAGHRGRRQARGHPRPRSPCPPPLAARSRARCRCSASSTSRAALAEAEPFEIALADTIGVGVPAQVIELVGRVREAVPAVSLRCHFHNTRNTGLANAFAAVQAGVTTLDASLGGIGGCPFAPAATGNIPTEDLLYMLHRSGYETGISLTTAISTARWLQEQLGRPVPGMLVKAGDFAHAAAQVA